MARVQAVKKGIELKELIRTTTVPHGNVGVWWLGQATFCFKFGTTIVYIDPETLPGAAKASPDAKIVLPKWNVDFVADMGVARERMVPMLGDDTVKIGDITIHASPTAHETLDHDEKRGYRYLGYVLEGNGARIYHTGDVQPYPGWCERVKKFEPYDAAFLPISAVDNLHWSQAVYFATLHKPKIAVPMHYGMFPNYTEDPKKFVDALSRNAPEQKTRIMKIGEGWLV